MFENESKHSEVNGMILQNFKNFDIDVFLPPPTRMSFLDVYQNMPERFGTFHVLDAANFDDHAAQRYDLVFFNTAQQAWNARISASTPQRLSGSASLTRRNSPPRSSPLGLLFNLKEDGQALLARGHRASFPRRVLSSTGLSAALLSWWLSLTFS